MPLEAIFDRALGEVADGRHVDWDVSQSGAADENEREALKWLKILGDIADLHRSTHESLEELDAAASHPAPAPRDVPAAGVEATWGRYELVEKVGEGSFGNVYRAWDPKLEREVAVKILHPHIADTGVTERLVREGRALARVRHPNVVSVFDVETHGGRVGLCMDFVQGQTLEGVLRTQGTLSAAEAAVVGQDICRALAAVHHAGFVHRDVKARNVMREQAGRIVLMDFGTGREARALQASEGRDVGGTPLYMAPEVVYGEPASIQSDVYAVGVLLYYMATGTYPITANSMTELRAAHRESRRHYLSEARPDLPVPFVRVVERALAHDRQDRFTSAGALVEALASCAGQTEPVTFAGRLLRVGIALVGGMALLVVLGLLSSTEFNMALGRRDFATETLWDWWVWGLRASMLPLWILALAAISRAVCRSAVRTAVRVSSTAARVDRAVRHRAGVWADRLLLNDASVVSSWVLIVSSAMLAVAVWYFWPLTAALSGNASVAPTEALTLLSPGAEPFHDLYRRTFALLLLAICAGWYFVLRVGSRRRQHAHAGMLAAGAVVVAVSLWFLYYPYRVLLQNRFEVVNWDGTECYILAERSEDVLLLCPGLQPPRNRTVQKKSGSLTRLGRFESVYTRFSPGAGGGAPGPDAARD